MGIDQDRKLQRRGAVRFWRWREKYACDTVECFSSFFFSGAVNVLLSPPTSGSPSWLPSSLFSPPLKVSLRHKSKKKTREGKMLSSLCLCVCDQQQFGLSVGVCTVAGAISMCGEGVWADTGLVSLHSFSLLTRLLQLSCISQPLGSEKLTWILD